MRIFLYELKKIWSPALLLIIVAACAVMYYIFLYFNIEYFPNGHPGTERHAWIVQMIERYGTTLEPDEFDEWYAQYGELTNETNETDEANMMLVYRIQSMDSIAKRYSHMQAYVQTGLWYDKQPDESYKRHLTMIVSSGACNIMSDELFEATNSYGSYLALLCVLATLILVSPLVTADRARRVTELQYTSKSGRRILGTQFAAMMLSSFILTTILVAFFGFLFNENDFLFFWTCKINGFLSNQVLRRPITYGAYICIFVAAIYSVSLTAAGFAFLLSRFSRNLIALLLKLLPLFALLAFLTVTLLRVLLVYHTDYAPPKFIWTEPAIFLSFLLLAILSAFFFIWREKKTDL
jgi:hypothetical protein